MKRLLLGVALAAMLGMTGLGHATITRLLFLDQNSGLVQDDYDIYTYPHLVPGYSNTFFVNVSPTVWASTTVDLGKIGTIGMATNKPYSQRAFFSGITDKPNLRGFLIQDLPGLPNTGNINPGQAVAPTNCFVIPDDKIVAIYGLELSKIDIGFLLEWAAQNRAASWGPKNQNGDPVYNPGILSVSPYQPGFGGQALVSLENKQDSSGLRLSPSVGFDIGKLGMDFAFFVAFNGESSSHTEEVRDNGGANPDKSTITEAWKDKGNFSYGVNIRGRLHSSEKSSFVTVITYANQDLSMKHEINASASGPLVVAPFDAWANDTYVDADELYSGSNWSVTEGWVSNLNPRTLFLFALSLKGSGTKYEEENFTPKAVAPAKRSDSYRSSNTVITVNEFGLPFTTGIEYEPTPWAKLRATMGRYILGSTSMDVTQSFFNAGGTQTGSRPVTSSNNANVNWIAGLGGTATWGQFGLDLGFSFQTPKLEDSSPSIDGQVNADMTFKF